MKKIIFILLFGISLCTGQVVENSEWHFGNNKLIFPNTTGNPSSSSSNQNLTNFPTNCGLGSVSDSNGNLLFTAQKHIKDINGNIMPNGNDIHMGNNYKGVQSSVIIKSLENENQYYVFTNDYDVSSSSSAVSNGLNYSIVDMSLNSGLGGVIPNQKDINLYDGLVPHKMTTTISEDGESYWLLVTPRTENTNNFRIFAYNISCAGISEPVISLHPALNFSTSSTGGQIKVSPNGKRIAFAWGSAQTISYADFDNETGIVTNYITIDTSSYIGAWANGIEFSPDNSKLYFSTSRTLVQESLGRSSHTNETAKVRAGSSLVQIPLGKSGNGLTQVIYSSSSSVVSRLQLAVNNKIYVTRGSNYNSNLGVINSPNLFGVACDFDIDGVVLNFHNGNFLPQLVPVIQNPLLECCPNDWPKIFTEESSASSYHQYPNLEIDNDENVIITERYDSYSPSLTKYDKCGLLLWTLDLNSQQHIDQLNIDSNNNIIVSHSNHTSFETNISKYDPNGNLLWTVPINGIITYAYDDNLLIDIDSNNDIIFSGNVYNNQLNIDGSPIVSSNQKNVVIGKLNSLNGTLIWHDLIKGLTTTGCDLTTNAGFVYLYSKTSSGDSTITFNNSNSQFAINNTGILVRFNALNGNYISSNNLSVSVNKPNVEFLNGNLILSGSSSILYKINTMTATVNSVTVNNVINDIDIDQNSNTIYATHGGNLFATKLDQNLNTLWTLSATSSPFGLVSTGISTFNNKIFMIGRYNNLNQGDIIINNEITFPSADAGFDDAGNLFILRANEENNLPLFGRFQEEEPLLFSQEIDFSIVPNPSNGVAKIFLSDPNENYSIDIIDFTGNKINSSENNPEIDLTSFPKGIYFVKVTDFKGNSRTKKIIKQ